MPGEKRPVNFGDPVEKLKKDLDRSVRFESRKKVVIGGLLFIVFLTAAGGYYYYLNIDHIESAGRLGSDTEKPVSVVRVTEENAKNVPAEKIVKEAVGETSEETTVKEKAKDDLGEIIEVEDPFEAIIKEEMAEETDSLVSSPVLPDNNSRQYAVQVGAFKVERNALRLAEKLRNKGYEVSVIVQKFKNGQLMYRLLIGRYNDKDHAIEERRSLTEKEGLEGFVTPL